MSAAPAHATPGNEIDVDNSPFPCIPTPIIPKRTRSLGGTKGSFPRVFLLREAPAAAAPAPINSRRDQLLGLTVSPGEGRDLNCTDMRYPLSAVRYCISPVVTYGGGRTTDTAFSVP